MYNILNISYFDGLCVYIISIINFHILSYQLLNLHSQKIYFTGKCRLDC